MNIYMHALNDFERNMVDITTGCVLSGGRSRRMGTDKALLSLGGKTLITTALEGFAGFHEILISAEDAERYAFLGVPVIPDERHGIGPLGGLISAIKATESMFVCFRPVDTPFVPPALHRLLASNCIGKDAAVPVFQNRTEPLLACIAKTALPVLQGLAVNGVFKTQEIFTHLDAEYVQLEVPELITLMGDPASYLVNANDPETFRTLERRHI